MLDRVPTTIITGFLGSGKTTIISHLIDHLRADKQQVIYIKNEIGDQDIDGQLMRSKQVVSRELLNGCICCTLVGPFISAINEVVDTYHPDRIIIEASGAADPAALALMVSGHPRLIRDAVISVIDVVNFEGYQELTTTAQAQTRLTDLIIFNKIELADLARKQAVVGYVRELNTHSPILEAPQGRIAPHLVFGARTAELAALISRAETASHHHHIVDDQLQSIRCDQTKPIKKEYVLDWLTQLSPQVFRVKGIIQDQNGQQWLINRVAARTTCEPIALNTGTSVGTLIFIGFRLQELETDIRSKWQTIMS